MALSEWRGSEACYQNGAVVWYGVSEWGGGVVNKGGG